MAFEVVSYTPAAFRGVLVAHSGAEPAHVDRKLASGYWDQYLSAIGVRTIVAESDYVDHDYLEDFAAYYVKCFTHTLVVDVLFDATAITTGRYVRRVIVYNPKLDTVIRHVATLSGSIPDLLNRVFSKVGPAAP